ncbi:MAG: Crp/Fnr family transcriptional regulator [Steroidobacteraceae bacterium]|nr:Crp/Fnr family transcriptional regulator [Steroidobacteraceae bacterium]
MRTVRALANRDAELFSARCNGRTFRRQIRSPLKKVRIRADNSLLAALPAMARRRLTAGQVPVDLIVPEILSDAGERIRHVYFPIDGFISLITPAKGRRQLEIGLVGSEGMLGVPLLLGVSISPFRAMVQGGGRAWRVDAATLQQEIMSNAGVRATLNRYLYVFLAQLMQTSTCTRFHRIDARLARWLLMTRDRAHTDHFHLTHEFLALMLGVRRVGVTRAATALQRRELIRYRRGDISVLDVRGLERAACACYAVDKGIYARIIGSKGAQQGAAASATAFVTARVENSMECYGENGAMSRSQ